LRGSLCLRQLQFLGSGAAGISPGGAQAPRGGDVIFFGLRLNGVVLPAALGPFVWSGTVGYTSKEKEEEEEEEAQVIPSDIFQDSSLLLQDGFTSVARGLNFCLPFS